MPQNFFVCGEPKSGKTTLLKNIIEELRKGGLKVGGFISPCERHHGTRTAFHVVDISSGKQEVLASVDGDGPKVSKYHVDVKAFERIAMPSMSSVEDYDVFVIDEIGRMEMKSRKFARLLERVFESHTPVLASLHLDFKDRYGASGEVFMLTDENRNSVYFNLLRSAKDAFSKKKERQRMQPERKAEPRAKTGKREAKKAARAPEKAEKRKDEKARAEAKTEKKAPPKPLKKTEQRSKEERKSLWQHIRELIKG